MFIRSAITIVCLVSFNALAEGLRSSDQELDRCLQNVKAVQSGYVFKVEKLNFQGTGVYELEIVDPSHGEWEFLCDAKSGRIIEQEAEARSATDPRFIKNTKISEQEAAKIALNTVPGKIDEVEYELESDGKSSYEFDIVSDKGVESKIEVDAATGKIVEMAHEDWEIGEEITDKK